MIKNCILINLKKKKKSFQRCLINHNVFHNLWLNSDTTMTGINKFENIYINVIKDRNKDQSLVMSGQIYVMSYHFYKLRSTFIDYQQDRNREFESSYCKFELKRLYCKSNRVLIHLNSWLNGEHSHTKSSSGFSSLFCVIISFKVVSPCFCLDCNTFTKPCFAAKLMEWSLK